MKSGRSRRATGEWRIVSIAIFSAFLASCTATGENGFGLTSTSFNSNVTGSAAPTLAESSHFDQTDTSLMASSSTPDGTTDVSSSTAPVIDEDAPVLPEQVAYLPTSNPAAALPMPLQQQELADSNQSVQPAKTAEAHADGSTASDTAPIPTPSPARFAGDPPATADAATAPTSEVQATAAAQPAPIEPKKRGFLSAFFGSPPAHAATQPRKPTPIIQLASTGPSKPLVTASLGGSAGGADLPGVRQSALFEITRKSGLDDDSDVDLHEDEGEPIQIASAAGLARLAPNGLLTQTDRVDVACLKPSLVRVLKAVERHYGEKVIVTSGYRSPTHNRRARGAKHSLHMYCAAADVQIKGVSKWELAAYMRSMPGRGGVGTYCHTNSVHVDVGPERDWNWRCRRRK